MEKDDFEQLWAGFYLETLIYKKSNIVAISSTYIRCHTGSPTATSDQARLKANSPQALIVTLSALGKNIFPKIQPLFLTK